MYKEVTLPLPEEMYNQAEAIAKLTNRSLAEVLIEYITMPDTDNLENRKTNGESDIDKEEAAFIRLHPWLWKTYPHEYVAIHDGELVDHDADQVALFLRIKERFPTKFVWIAPVQEKPIEEYVVRSPRSAEGG